MFFSLSRLACIVSNNLRIRTPPTSAAALAEWCGARMGRWPNSLALNLPTSDRSAALSMASRSDIGGRMPGSRWASMLLPVPGGPTSRRLWRPAAAISSSERAESTCAPGASAASPADAAGTINTRLADFAASAIASAPRTGRKSPFKPNSPANSNSASRLPGSCPVAASSEIAMGRSNRPDSLGISAGARFAVSLRYGNSKPAVWMAARTRSRDSRTSTSGSPTRLKLALPLATCSSTVTGSACIPARARECAIASDINDTFQRA